MTFNDTTNKNGIIQECEFWTLAGDGGISGDATVLKQFVARVNIAFDRLMPILLSWGEYLKWDDTNHTDQPIGTFNIVSGQADYTLAEDDNSLDILDIKKLLILPSSTATNYLELEEITAESPLVAAAMSPNSGETGVPNYWLKRGNTLFLYPKPNYAATNGVKIMFEREQSYFTSADTTKEPGIPKPFHRLLPLYAAYDWLLVNKPANATLITRIEAEIQKAEAGLKKAIKGRYPARNVMKGIKVNYI